jgi:hypothetical protein
LARDVVIFDDRAGEAWERKDVKAIEQGSARRRRDATIDVDKIGDLFKDDEADADRQRSAGC